jgi:hypothetical protein
MSLVIITNIVRSTPKILRRVGKTSKTKINMETFLVFLSNGLKLVFTIVLLLGWIFAWKLKSKGGGYLLWIIYIVCVLIAAALMLFPPDLFSRNDAVREFFMSDQGFIASLNGGRGLRFPAAQSISVTNGIQIGGMLFCLIALYFWKRKKITSNKPVESK